MKIYVFGNEDLSFDNTAIELAKKLSVDFPDIEFVDVKPNEDLPFIGEDNIVLMDVVYGLSDVKIFNDDAIDHLVLSPRSSVHDFDLNFQLKYLKKLKKIGSVTIIGLPGEGELIYDKVKETINTLCC